MNYYHCIIYNKNRISNSYLNEEYCDITFKIKKESIIGMKLIISLQSDFFKALFKENNNSDEIKVDCNDCEGFKEMIKFMHGFDVFI